MWLDFHSSQTCELYTAVMSSMSGCGMLAAGFQFCEQPHELGCTYMSTCRSIQGNQLSGTLPANLFEQHEHLSHIDVSDMTSGAVLFVHHAAGKPTVCFFLCTQLSFNHFSGTLPKIWRSPKVCTLDQTHYCLVSSGSTACPMCRYAQFS